MPVDVFLWWFFAPVIASPRQLEAKVATEPNNNVSQRGY